MTANTGLLTARCDPFGAESRIQLMGGTVDPKHVGRIMWHCEERAIGRYRMVCTGGAYGQRITADGAVEAAYHCPGGHRGQPMTLCAIHVKQFSVGPAKPWYDSSGQPHGIVGGTNANGLCPACAMTPQARELSAKAEALQAQIGQMISFGLLSKVAALETMQNQVRERLTELYHTGRVHRCPLVLQEMT